MLNYLKNSEVSIRVGLNPFNWKWIPASAYDGPSEFYPKRRTFAVIWLGISLFLDIDDGTSDMSPITQLFGDNIEVIDEQSEVGHSLSKASERSLDVE